MILRSTLKKLSTALVALLALSSAHALTLCVNDSASLKSALDVGSIQTATPLTIQIVQSTYLVDADWEYQLSAPTLLEGGYTASCLARQVNPANTVINGQGHAVA